jgi:hypothetical protein
MRKILVDLGVAEGVPRIRSDSHSVEGQTCLALEVTTGRGCAYNVSAQPRAVGQYAQ